MDALAAEMVDNLPVLKNSSVFMAFEACFKVTGPATVDYAVPAEILVQAVQGLQQSLWLIAAAREERTVHRRFKPDQSFRQRFTLELAVPKVGSYALPIRLRDCRPQVTAENPAEDLLEVLRHVWAALSKDDLPSARAQIGDQWYFLRVMQELHRMLPKRGDRWGLCLGTAGTAQIELTARHRSLVTVWLKSPTEQRETAVIGELLRIDFAQKRLWILYPPTQREIECTYFDDVEEGIIDARRGLFQVTGQFVLDAEGHPLRLTDVRAIEPVDLSPVELGEVTIDGGTLTLDPPILLSPRLDDDEKQYFLANVEAFNLTLSGRTREELLEDWEDQVRFIWRDYALAQESDLAPDALDLRRTLLSRVTPRRGNANT